MIDWLKNPEYTKEKKYDDEEYVKFGKDIEPKLFEVLYADVEDFIIEKICRILRKIQHDLELKKLIDYCLHKETKDSHRLIVLETIDCAFKSKYIDKEMIELTKLFAFSGPDVRIKISKMIREYKSIKCEKLLIYQFKSDNSVEVKLSLALTLYTLNSKNKTIVLPFIHELLPTIKSNDNSIRASLFKVIPTIKANETLDIILKLYKENDPAAKYLIPEPIAYYNTDERAAKVLCEDLENPRTGYTGKTQTVTWLKNFDFDCVRNAVSKVLADRLEKDDRYTKGTLGCV